MKVSPPPPKRKTESLPVLVIVALAAVELLLKVMTAPCVEAPVPPCEVNWALAAVAVSKNPIDALPVPTMLPWLINVAVAAVEFPEKLSPPPPPFADAEPSVVMTALPAVAPLLNETAPPFVPAPVVLRMLRCAVPAALLFKKLRKPLAPLATAAPFTSSVAPPAVELSMKLVVARTELATVLAFVMTVAVPAVDVP